MTALVFSLTASFGDLIGVRADGRLVVTSPLDPVLLAIPILKKNSQVLLLHSLCNRIFTLFETGAQPTDPVSHALQKMFTPLDTLLVHEDYPGYSRFEQLAGIGEPLVCPLVC